MSLSSAGWYRQTDAKTHSRIQKIFLLLPNHEQQVCLLLLSEASAFGSADTCSVTLTPMDTSLTSAGSRWEVSAYKAGFRFVFREESRLSISKPRYQTP